MEKLATVAAMVCAAACLASFSESLGIAAVGVAQARITADTIYDILYGAIWLAIASAPAWILVAPIPFLLVLIIKARVKERITGALGHIVVGAALGLLFVVPISELMTHLMIAVEDDGNTPESQRWLFETPFIMFGSTAVWLGLWWFENNRKHGNVG